MKSRYALARITIFERCHVSSSVNTSDFFFLKIFLRMLILIRQSKTAYFQRRPCAQTQRKRQTDRQTQRDRQRDTDRQTETEAHRDRDGDRNSIR